MPSSTSLAEPKRRVAPAALRSMASQVRGATAGSLPRFSPDGLAGAGLPVRYQGPKPNPSATPFQWGVRNREPCAEPSPA